MWYIANVTTSINIDQLTVPMSQSNSTKIVRESQEPINKKRIRTEISKNDNYMDITTAEDG